MSEKKDPFPMQPRLGTDCNPYPVRPRDLTKTNKNNEATEAREDLSSVAQAIFLLACPLIFFPAYLPAFAVMSFLSDNIYIHFTTSGFYLFLLNVISLFALTAIFWTIFKCLYAYASRLSKYLKIMAYSVIWSYIGYCYGDLSYRIVEHTDFSMTTKYVITFACVILGLIFFSWNESSQRFKRKNTY